MSWLEKNYEKAAVGAAVVVALGLGALGWLKLSGVSGDFSSTVPSDGGKGPEVATAGLVTAAIADRSRDLSFTQKQTPDGRVVDIFTGVPLFVHRDQPEVAIDLLTDKPVHASIPNEWWVRFHIDPGFADSPKRDADGDGYSNMEEQIAKTAPTNPDSHPSLLDKLKYHNDDSFQWSLRPGFPENGKASFKLYIAQDPVNAKNKTEMDKAVAPGGTFFSKGEMKDRFRFLDFVKRKELNKSINIEQEITYARVEDLKPNKKGVTYEIPAPLTEGRILDNAKFDRSAVVSLEAAGNEGKQETIPENTRFALPFEAKEKNYLLKKVTLESIEVEATNPKTGTTTTVTIPKGGFATPAQ